MKKRKAPEIEPPSEGMLIGYARVSTEDQSLDAQVARLISVGCHPDHIHTDQVSAVSKRRPGLAMLLKDVREGDTVVVVSLDRFARSLSELIRRLEDFDKRGIHFKSLSQSIDTSTSVGRLILHVLGAVAEFERALIAERTKRSMQYRKSQGAKFGREWKLPPDKRKAVADMVRQGVRTVDIAKQFGISRGSVRNYSKHVKKRRRPGRPPVSEK